MITPVNHSCKLNFGSDFNSCDSYFRSDVTPVKSNLGVIFTIVIFVYKSGIIFFMNNMRSEILKNLVESTVLVKQGRRGRSSFRDIQSRSVGNEEFAENNYSNRAKQSSFGIFSTEITYSP